MATNDFYRVVTMVGSAVSYMDVFGEKNGGKGPGLDTIKGEYRRLVRHIHPDRVDAYDQDVARSAYDRLTELYQSACNATTRGNYGAVAAKEGPISTAAGVHHLGAAITADVDMTSCWFAESEIGGATISTIVKMAAGMRDNDLLAAEAAALERLNLRGDPARIVFYPELLDSFAMECDGARVRVNVFRRLEEFSTLASVIRRYPGGIDPLDAGWIWRRMLWALDYVHDRGLVHGAVVPSNILVHGVLHGVVLSDWCYSVTKTGASYRPLSAVVSSKREWYPASVFQKKPADCSVDLVMATRSLIALMGGDPLTGTLPSSVPSLYARHIEKCMQADGRTTAIDLLSDFDKTLESLGEPYYPRRYRALTI